MAPRPVIYTHLSLFVTAIILLACTATGMLAGTFAHTIAGGLADGKSPNGPVVSGTPPAASHATAISTLSVDEIPTSVSTATSFILSIASSSRTLSAGDKFTITVVATVNGAPLAGLTCVLRAPMSGPTGLLSTWPTPATTNVSGQATWTLTAPSVAPGTYGIEVDAVGGHHYEFHRYTTVQVA